VKNCIQSKVTSCATLVVLMVLPGTCFSADAKIDLKGLTPAEVAATFTAHQDPRWVADEIIVKYKADSGPIGAMDLGDSVAAPRKTSAGEYVFRIVPKVMNRTDLADPAPTQEQARRLVEYYNSKKATVEYAQLNYYYHALSEPNDPSYPTQWHYLSNGPGRNQSPGGINLPRAWAHTTGTRSVVVAIIDTGIVGDHPDLDKRNLVPGYNMIFQDGSASPSGGRGPDPTDPGDAVAPDECFPGSAGSPSSWHGTHVAGTIGAVGTNNRKGVAGINWAVRIQPIRVLGKCGGQSTDIDDAIRWAAGIPVDGHVNPTPAKIINLSLGGKGRCSEAPAEQAAINAAIAKGVTVIVAAGNDAADASNTTPASCEGVIAVAASDYNGDLVTRYSNYGPVVKIMAPGGDLTADLNHDGYPDGVLSIVKDGYAFYNGTSMAAPHVAGVAALLLSKHPEYTPQDVIQVLQRNALARSPTQCPQPCGAGLLNADMPELSH
jgi:serine protease